MTARTPRVVWADPGAAADARQSSRRGRNAGGTRCPSQIFFPENFDFLRPAESDR
jgi:hypothetical protein